MKKSVKKQSLVLLLACSALTLQAQTQHGFRGPTRDGHYPDKGLMKSWAAAGPTLLWETLDAGKGYSSPVIYQGSIYVTGMNEEETRETFTAYTMEGKQKYSVEYGSPWAKTYPETRTTPAIKDGKAYLTSGSGEIICLDLSNGAEVWRIDAVKRFEISAGYWGTAECPLLVDDKMIFTTAGKQTTMVALNSANGEVVWKTKSLDSYGCYVSPILINHRGKPQIVGSTANHIFGVNPANGTIEWCFEEWGREAPKNGLGGEPGSDTYVRLNNAINMPIYHDGKIFFSQGYEIGAYLLELNADASAVKLLWKNVDFDTHLGAQVIVDNVIYGSTYVSTNAGNWMAVDWNTGETKYDVAWSGGKGKGSIITADGMLYCYDERRGAIGLVNPTPEKFEVISEFRITKGEGPHWAHLVIDNGILYVRHGNALMAYNLKP